MARPTRSTSTVRGSRGGVLALSGARTLAALLSLLLAGVPPAGAVVLQAPTGELVQPFQQWADSALVPTTPATITLHLAPCPVNPDRAGCTSHDASMWIDDPDEPRRTLMHELGHQFDYTVMTDPARDAFRALIHDPRPWVSPPNSPHEQFAEAYQLCAQHRRIFGTAWGSYDYRVGPRRHRRVCRLIRQAAAGVYGHPMEPRTAS